MELVNMFESRSNDVKERSCHSDTGSVPLRPRPVSVSAEAPPIMVDPLHENVEVPSLQLTPAHDLPYTGELLFCDVYGGHGCSPARQLGSSAPLGSSAAAADCRMADSGASKPRLVPYPHPVPPGAANGALLP